MKALSLHQPYASLMAIGAKKNETRSRRWDSLLSQDLAICSCAHFPAKYRLWAEQDKIFRATLAEANLLPADLPLGMVLCVVTITSTSDTDWFQTGRATGHAIFKLSDQERAFGDYGEDRFVYTTGNLRRLKTPVPVRGHQGVFNLPPDVEAAVRAQI